MRAQEDARRTGLIRQTWPPGGEDHGYRKLTFDLRDQGEGIPENPIAIRV